MTHHAFGPAEESPRLLPGGAGSGRVADAKFAFPAFFGNQASVCLFVIPFVRIARPFTPLTGHQARLDQFATGRVAVLHFERQSLHGDGSVQELPTAGTPRVNGVVVRHSQQTGHARAVVPAGRVHGIRNDPRRGLLLGHRFKNSRLAQQLRKLRRAFFGSGIRVELQDLPRQGDQIQLVCVIASPRGAVVSRICQHAVIEDSSVFVAKSPDGSRLVAAIKIVIGQFR